MSGKKEDKAIIKKAKKLIENDQLLEALELVADHYYMGFELITLDLLSKFSQLEEQLKNRTITQEQFDAKKVKFKKDINTHIKEIEDSFTSFLSSSVLIWSTSILISSIFFYKIFITPPLENPTPSKVDIHQPKAAHNPFVLSLKSPEVISFNVSKDTGISILFKTHIWERIDTFLVNPTMPTSKFAKALFKHYYFDKPHIFGLMNRKDIITSGFELYQNNISIYKDKDDIEVYDTYNIAFKENDVFRIDIIRSDGSTYPPSIISIPAIGKLSNN